MAARRGRGFRLHDWLARVAVVGVLLAACASPAVLESSGRGGEPEVFPTGPLSSEVIEALDHRFQLVGRPRDTDVETIVAAGDVRLAWPLVDLLRFEAGTPLGDEVEAGLIELVGEAPSGSVAPWVHHQDVLLRRDVPAPPDYLRWKRAQHRAFDPWFDFFFLDDADIDWRAVSWGGVPAGGIAELDHPEVIEADAAHWLRDDDVVFGVVVDGRPRAYPRRILEVHELVNDTLGGMPIALAHCTLCGVATGWDRRLGEATVELATSGLLLRSNKLMFDRGTNALFDQFDGVALTGAFADAGLALEPVAVAVAQWEAWRAAHPSTTTLERPLPPEHNLFDPYDGRFLADRPDHPIFPTGPVDDRLAPQVEVLGVQGPDGVAVAFVRDEVEARLASDAVVEAGGIRLTRADAWFEARPAGGGPSLPITQSFWFAWAQFRVDTLLWNGPA